LRVRVGEQQLDETPIHHAEATRGAVQMNRGKAVVTMAKKDIHPEFVESAKVRPLAAAGSQMHAANPPSGG
jgi:hypothetical protein